MRSLRLTAAAICALATASSIAAEPGNWPQWRGPQRDGVSHESGLLAEWPEGGPAVAWEVENVGLGYSSVAIANGRIITQGDLDGIEHIVALSEADGSLLWAVQPEPVAAALASRVQQQLETIDLNDNGVVDEVEALRGMGAEFGNYDRVDAAADVQQLAATRAAELVAALDGDADGRLNFEEAGMLWRDAYVRIDADNPQADLATLAQQRTDALFAARDANKDGQLDKKEQRGTFAEVQFKRIEEKLPGSREGDGLLTRDEVLMYLAKSERGRDGVLTAEELAAFYVRELAGRDGKLTADELRSYYGGYRNNKGDGPRGTPTIEAGRVYVEGGQGDVTCLDAATGKTIWHVNLIGQFGGTKPNWGYSESPLIVDNLLIVTPGGPQGTVLALDKRTGEMVWQSSGIVEAAHYSSPVLAEFYGVPQIVQFAKESCFGVRLEDGKPMWNYSNANNGTANCATPIVEGNYVLAASAYGTGGGLAKISGDSTSQQATEVYFEPKMQNHHGGIVKVGDYIYGFGANALICMHYVSGEVAWMDRSVGKGSLVAAGGMLYCLGEKFEMALVEATPEEYREHGRFAIEDLGQPSWAHPVVAGGRLYVRNQQRLTAYRVGNDQ